MIAMIMWSGRLGNRRTCERPQEAIRSEIMDLQLIHVQNRINISRPNQTHYETCALVRVPKLPFILK